MKKLLTILLVAGLIIYLFVGCNGVTPSEDEGEGEGEEEVSRVVMVELFTQPDCNFCEIAEPIIEQLADEYERSEVVFLEERISGLYSLDEIRDRCKWYFLSVSDRSTPNILFNGLNQRIHHITTTDSMIKGKINTELAKDAKVSIRATRNSNSTTTTISGTIKNISSSSFDNLVINGMTYKDRGKTGLKYSVTDIFAEQVVEISTLAPGDSYNFSFTLEDINWVANKIHGLIFVQDTDSSTKEILQVSYID